ncbi:RNA-directed DNA polymerase-like protein [Cucumis melo var. makuwa]|uniref:RNA-directed DNA polymerase-like protein n=1 Tax=Cucumis melo var. makuwa TaxID=1194695 RepID=A0A5D3DVN1_CUCMM|nr:RNA-directed DNA polymerase-like protein [Cucumis melo var. makuwa]
MKVVNSIVLPLVRLVKQTMIKLRGWNSLVDFLVVKMDNFEVVLGIEFLLEHQKYSDVILDSLPKSLLLQWAIDHEIELLPREKPVAKNAYHMALPELDEL